MRPKILLFIIVLSFLSRTASAQVETVEEPAYVPNAVRAQVVRRILTWYFKPRSRPKTIYLLNDGVTPAMLPAIRNIEFQLVSDAGKPADVYFFQQPYQEGSKLRIGFGYGDPNCSAIGESWFFNVSGSRVRLWQAGSFGMGCAVSASEGSGTWSGASKCTEVELPTH